jgi:hypothetical protein
MKKGIAVVVVSLTLVGGSVFADEATPTCDDSLLVARTSVEYLSGQRNALESNLVTATAQVKRLREELEAVKKANNAEKKDDKPKK